MGSSEVQTDVVVTSAEKPRRVPTEEEFAAQHPEPPPAHWIDYGPQGRYITAVFENNFFAVDPVMEQQMVEEYRRQEEQRTGPRRGRP